jgi:hypothetical protein
MSAYPAPPDWQLERFRLGELPAEEGQAVRRWLAHNDGGGREPGAGRRLAALDKDDAEILEHYPPHQVAARVRARLAERRPSVRARRPRPVPALALGAALAVCLAMLIPGAAPPSATRVKGLTPHLLVFRQRPAPAAEVERLLPGSTARHHDLVQLAYQGAGRRYGVIVSIDGRGVVTRHLPAEGPLAVPLEAGAVALPQSYELDDAPAFERFYLIAADAPFAVETIVEAVRRGPAGGGGAQPLDLPPSMDQATFVLRKEPVS